MNVHKGPVASQSAVVAAIKPAVVAAYQARVATNWGDLPQDKTRELRDIMYKALGSVPGFGARGKARMVLMQSVLAKPDQGKILGDLLGFHEYFLAMDIIAVCGDMDQDPTKLRFFNGRELKPIIDAFDAKHGLNKAFAAPTSILDVFDAKTTADDRYPVGKALRDFVYKTGSYAPRDNKGQQTKKVDETATKVAELTAQLEAAIAAKKAALEAEDGDALKAAKELIASTQAELDALTHTTDEADDDDHGDSAEIVVEAETAQVDETATKVAELTAQLEAAIAAKKAALEAEDGDALKAAKELIASTQAELDALNTPATETLPVVTTEVPLVATVAETIVGVMTPTSLDDMNDEQFVAHAERCVGKEEKAAAALRRLRDGQMTRNKFVKKMTGMGLSVAVS